MSQDNWRDASAADLAEYFRDQANWRGMKAEEYPDDVRNVQSAEALEDLADYVDAHPDDATVRFLVEHIPATGAGPGGEETQRAVSRYGFGYRVTQMHHAGFLEELAVLCLVDAYESCREVGDGEDWTGTLYPFEVEAAQTNVFLPQSYFEQRRHWTEQEAQQAVAQYRGES
jgi:hypothetical protein